MSPILQQLIDPFLYLTIWPLVGPAALICLVAIWAATSRGHWFWRALGIGAAILPLVPIQAWEPAWTIALSSAIIVASLTIGRFLNRRASSDQVANQARPARRSFRFGLRDLFLLLLVVGLYLPVLIEIVRHGHLGEWLGWIVSSFAVATIAVIAYFCVHGQLRWLAVLLLLVAVPGCASAAWAAGDWMQLTNSGLFGLFLPTIIIAAAELALTLVSVLTLIRAAQSSDRKWFKIALVLPLVVAGGSLCWMYLYLLQRPPKVARLQTPTNHYERILAIATRVRAINPTNLTIADMRRTLPQSGIAEELESLFAELTPLLTAPNAIPYDPDGDANEYLLNGSQAQTWRTIVRWFQAEAELARQNNQPDRAAEHGLAAVQLSLMLGRGGGAVDALVGRALEGVGHTQFAKLRGDLSPAQSRTVLAMLQRSLRERENCATLRARELDLAERAFGWRARLEELMFRLRGVEQPWISSMDHATQRAMAYSMLLQSDLAVRLFANEHGRLPVSLEEVVPQYLPAVPLDPYSSSGEAIRYKTHDTGFVVYSLGHDSKDDGGRFGNSKEYWSSDGYDFDLDTISRP